MRFVLEAIPALVALGGLIWGVRYALRRWRAQRQLTRARWTTRVRSRENNRVAVEVFRPGEETQTVAELDAGSEDFDTQLFDAQSRAEHLAAALNAVRQ